MRARSSITSARNDMIKRITVWGVVAVAIVLAVEILRREGPPKSLVVPPKMELPAVDDVVERESPAERAAPSGPK
jgi:hypothetical protein